MYVFVNEHNGNQKKRIFQIALVFTRFNSRTLKDLGEPGGGGGVGGGFVNCDLLCFKSLPFLVPRPRSSTRFVFPRPSDVCLSGLRDNTHVNCCKP